MLLLNQLLSLQIDAMLANERNIKLYKWAVNAILQNKFTLAGAPMPWGQSG